jgi:hypothetical protein
VRAVENEPDARFPAVDAKMAFTVARLLLGVGQAMTVAPAALGWLYHNHIVRRNQAVIAIGAGPDERPESYRNDNDAQATQNETQGPDRRNVKGLFGANWIPPEYWAASRDRAQQESTYNA